MSSLSTQSYKGSRDYFPEEKRLQNYIFNVWHKTVESFGYEEYGAPLLEPLDIYLAKSGQELAGEQTYAFEDRGGRMVAIRPEMTPSISRMVAAKRQELAMPARLYSIANFMRYERPQRGREREFWQLNADLFGVDGAAADAEIIELSHASVMNFGAKQEMFTVRVNNRQLINRLMSQFLKLDIVGSTMMMKLLDRKNKIPAEEFKRQAIEIFGNQASEGLPKLAKMISMKSVDDLPSELMEDESVKQLREVMKLLSQKGITNAVFDVTLMRGLDYYTGMVLSFLTIRQRITERCLAEDDMTDWSGYLALNRLLRSALVWARRRWNNFWKCTICCRNWHLNRCIHNSGVKRIYGWRGRFGAKIAQRRRASRAGYHR